RGERSHVDQIAGVEIVIEGAIGGRKSGVLDPKRRGPTIDQCGDSARFAQIQPEHLNIRFDRSNTVGRNPDIAVAGTADGSDDMVTKQRPMAREVMSNETRNACNNDFSHVKSAPWASRVETPMKASKTYQRKTGIQPKLFAQGALPA